MRRISWFPYCGLILVSALAAGVSAQVNPDLYAGLRWRNVGPFHGGRISSVTGVAGQSGVFYVGTPLGVGQPLDADGTATLVTGGLPAGT